ncbi:hypothetical protein KXW30_005833 [Aspergillus fumigatus]|nr:hypothetical protein KXX63_002849 [Aspergillus fumigatus]KAH1693232.1 hypothetical protein KXX24_003166 [Aspergillus fumigatus]KAH2127781.1 hypothetical protein KXV35_004058 [Aspergillus fumigatus]KAH2174969.1 hypothetical protein KXW61_004039 [Aspergillus fumigatus]KAH2327262.1 hypothetical protein KXW30_005833 [Aspergillus fumigatus]
MAYGYSSRRSGYYRSKRGYSGRYGRRRWGTGGKKGMGGKRGKYGTRNGVEMVKAVMKKELKLQAMGNPQQVIGVGKFVPNFVLNGSVHEWFVMGVEVMAFAYLGGPDRKLLMSAPAVHPKTREVLAGSGCVDVPVDGNFFENGISVPGDGGHKMEEDEVELVGQKSKRRKAATEVQGRFLMLEETGMVTSSGPMNVLKVGEKVLMDSKDGGLFDCNQSSGENGPSRVELSSISNADNRRVALAMKGLFVASALLASCVSGHIQMSKPYPIRSPLNPDANDQKDYSYTNPLSSDGHDYPCKGYANDPFKSVADYTPGQTYELELQGSATHGGGSCQIALSYDKGKTFKVIHSMLGGCPLTSKYNFQIPSDAPSGEALLAWSWFNKIGNREMYMNCAMVTIKGGSQTRQHARDLSPAFSRRAGGFDSLPPLFEANINGPGKCKTIEGQEVNFPLPGPSVEGSLSGKGYQCESNAPFLGSESSSNSPKAAASDQAVASTATSSSAQSPSTPSSSHPVVKPSSSHSPATLSSSHSVTTPSARPTRLHAPLRERPMPSQSSSPEFIYSPQSQSQPTPESGGYLPESQSSPEFAYNPQSASQAAPQSGYRPQSSSQASPQLGYDSQSASQGIPQPGYQPEIQSTPESEYSPQSSSQATPQSEYMPQSAFQSTGNSGYEPDSQTSPEFGYSPQSSSQASQQSGYKPQSSSQASAQLGYQPQSSSLATPQTGYQPESQSNLESGYNPQSESQFIPQSGYIPQSASQSPPEFGYSPQSSSSQGTSQTGYQPESQFNQDSGYSPQSASQKAPEFGYKPQSSQPAAQSGYQPQSSSQSSQFSQSAPHSGYQPQSSQSAAESGYKPQTESQAKPQFGYKPEPESPPKPKPKNNPVPEHAPEPKPSETAPAQGFSKTCEHGEILCGADGQTWAKCDWGKPVQMGPVAAGTRCSHGVIERT